MDPMPPNAPPYAEALLILRDLAIHTDAATLRDLAAAVLHIINDDKPGVMRAAAHLRARCRIAELLRAIAASNDLLDEGQRPKALMGAVAVDSEGAPVAPPASTLAYAASILDWHIGTEPAGRVAAVLRKHAGVCLGEDLQIRRPGEPTAAELRDVARALELAAEEHAELWGGGLHVVSGWLDAQARAMARAAATP